jgi:N-formylglutamate amidohydrolase
VTFVLARPPGRPAPLIVEVPHAGLDVPVDVADTLSVAERDLRRDADLYVDELYRAVPSCGATLLAARVSRYVVDLNRFEHDVDAAAVPGAPNARVNVPRGVIWRESTEGQRALRRPLTAAEFELRMERYYRPYHRALAAEIDAARQRFGHVILLSAHSMPSVGRAGHDDEGVRRADVVPGTQGRTTAHPAIIDAVETHFRAAGLSVRHDDPYRGGATTIRWGRAREGIHAVQVELNRALYMDEVSLARRQERFRWLASVCESLAERLADLDPGYAGA